MKIILRTLLVLYISLASIPSIAQSNDSCGCNAGLVKEVIKQTSDVRLQLSYYKQIDQSQFEQIKKDAKVEGDYLELISGSGSYNEFSEKRSRLIDTTSFNLSSSQSQSYLLDRVQTKEWGLCKRECIKNNQRGLRCEVSALTRDTAVTSCFWSVSGEARARKLRVVVNSKLTKTTTILPNALTTIPIQRNPNLDLILTYTVAGVESAEPMIIAAVPPETKVVVGPQCAPADAVIVAIYKQTLERLPDSDGMADRLKSLTSGTANVRQIIGALVQSEEHQARFARNKSSSDQISTLYMHIFAKPASSDIIQAYGARLRSNNYVDLAGELVNSQQYEDLYQSMAVPGTKVKYCR